MFEPTSRAARIQAKQIFHGGHLPAKTDHVLGRGLDCACDSLDMTATTANPEMKSPYELWFGRCPTPQTKPFLPSVVDHTKRSKKSEEHT